MESLALAAVTAALSVSGARAELVALRPSIPAGCAVAAFEAPRAVAASGDVALRARGAGPGGAPCDGWAWARVKVFAPALVTTRAVAEGEALDGAAVAREERELAAGRPLLASVPPGATAARTLGAGVALESAGVRVGPRPGEPVTVLVRVGTLTAEQPGRAVACPHRRACALLPSGRRVEGTYEDGRLVVEAP